MDNIIQQKMENIFTNYLNPRLKTVSFIALSFRSRQ